MKKIVKNIFAAAILVTVASCSDDDSPVSVVQQSDYNAHLTNIGNNVIVATYSDLANKAADLFTVTNTFKTTTINLALI